MTGKVKMKVEINNMISQNNGPREKLPYYNEDMFASPSARTKADDIYASPSARNNKAYLSNLSSSSNADRHPTEYGVKLKSPIQRKPNDYYVFNPLTQTPLLRFQDSHLVKRKGKVNITQYR